MIIYNNNNNLFYISYTRLMFSLFTTVAMPLVVNSFFNDMSAVDEAHRPVPYRGSTAVVEHFIFTLSDWLF